jgi:Uncharacterized conserved protein
MRISDSFAINQTNKAKSGRIKCIDAFRGLAIAIMIFVGNPENPSPINPKVGHALWNGLNLADLAFPFLIFVCGVSLPVSLRRKVERGVPKTKVYLHVISRSVIIFLTGLFLNGFPDFNLATIRIPGVLQRIAVVYLISGIIVLSGNIIAEAATAVSILVLYFILMKFVKVPGYGAGILQTDGNLVQYIDLKLLKGHLYTKTFDPEGILSTVSSISTILFGAICGELLISQKLGKSDWTKRVAVLIAAGVIFMLAGSFVSRWFPINKKLWSSSYVLYTSGIALLITGVLYLALDIIGYTTIFTPFLILGSNPFFVYIWSELAIKSVWLINVQEPNNTVIPLSQWLRTRIITPWAGKYDLYYFSILYVLLWALIAFIFKRNQYIRTQNRGAADKQIVLDK